MTYYFLENFEKYFLETLVQIESNSQKLKDKLSSGLIKDQRYVTSL